MRGYEFAFSAGGTAASPIQLQSGDPFTLQANQTLGMLGPSRVAIVQLVTMTLYSTLS